MRATAAARGKQPPLTINLAAVSEGVADSELFGHVRGAFTGAERTRKGIVRTASESEGRALLGRRGRVSRAHPGPSPHLSGRRGHSAGRVRRDRVGGSRAEPEVQGVLVQPTRRAAQAPPRPAGPAGRPSDRPSPAQADEPGHPPPCRRRVAEPGGPKPRGRAQSPVLEGRAPGHDELLVARQRSSAVQLGGPGSGKGGRDAQDRLRHRQGVPARRAMAAEAERGRRRRRAPFPTLAEAEARLVQEALAWTGGNVTQAARLLGVDRMTIHRRRKRMSQGEGSAASS